MSKNLPHGSGSKNRAVKGGNSIGLEKVDRRIDKRNIKKRKISSRSIKGIYSPSDSEVISEGQGPLKRKRKFKKKKGPKHSKKSV